MSDLGPKWSQNTVDTTKKERVSPTLTAVDDSRVIWRPKNDDVLILLSSKFGFFGPITAISVGKLRKIQIED